MPWCPLSIKFLNKPLGTSSRFHRWWPHYYSLCLENYIHPNVMCSCCWEGFRWTILSCSRQWFRWRLGHWRWSLRQHSLLTRLPWPHWCGRSLYDGTYGESQTPWCKGQWRSPWRWCLETKQMSTSFIKIDWNVLRGTAIKEWSKLKQLTPGYPDWVKPNNATWCLCWTLPAW